MMSDETIRQNVVVDITPSMYLFQWDSQLKTPFVAIFQAHFQMIANFLHCLYLSPDPWESRVVYCPR